METSTVAGIVGAVALALIGWLGKGAATVLRERGRLREITRVGETDVLKAREARPWALMEERINDLEQERERLALKVESQSALIDRIRDERDVAQRSAVDWEIKAKRAGAVVARNVDLEQQLERQQTEHAALVERLSAEIRRLRG